MQDAKIKTHHLDALRIIAACAVVILHYSDYVKNSAAGRVIYEHAQHFNLFVDLFFVISGFVIANQYMGKVDSIRSINRFLWRRLARIYPLHLATLAFYLVVAAAIHSNLANTGNSARYPLSDLPAQLLLLHALIGERLTFNFPSWSLSAEMFCYVIFPLIVVIASHRRSLLLPLIAIIIGLNGLFASATGTGPWASWINHGGVFRAFPAFILGITCNLHRDAISQWRIPPAALVIALAGFTLLGWSVPETIALGCIYIIAVIAIHCDCAGHHTLMTRLRIERGSPFTYSCYMLHIPVATVVISLGGRLVSGGPGPELALLPVAMAILAAASIVSYRYFETPTRNALNEAFDRWEASRVISNMAPERKSR
ncbi:MAG: acyltransferase family protein [Xanthobacteraceae bacterium]